MRGAAVVTASPPSAHSGCVVPCAATAASVTTAVAANPTGYPVQPPIAGARFLVFCTPPLDAGTA